MAKKKPRLSKDAFDWVKDTSQPASETGPKPPDEPVAAPPKKHAASPKKKNAAKAKTPAPASKPQIKKSSGKRLFVRYAGNGMIISLAEAGKGGKNPFRHLRSGEQTGEIELTAELTGKALAELHEQYHLDTTGKTTRLKAGKAPLPAGKAPQVSAQPAAAARRPGGKFQMYRDSKGKYRWRLRAANNEVIATSSGGYHNKSDCEKSIELIRTLSPGATLQMEQKD